MADKFGKSLSNKRTEDEGLSLLLSDPRMQAPERGLRSAIIGSMGVAGEFGPRSFDCILTSEPRPTLTLETYHDFLPEIRLVEMKTTKKPIKNSALNQFFFGATAREFELAGALGDRFLFAFVVLSSINDYGRPFAVLLTAEQLDERIKNKRVQFQVNLRSDMADDAAVHELVIFDTPDTGPSLRP